MTEKPAFEINDKLKVMVDGETLVLPIVGRDHGSHRKTFHAGWYYMFQMPSQITIWISEDTLSDLNRCG